MKRSPEQPLAVKVGIQGEPLWNALRQLPTYCPRTRTAFSPEQLLWVGDETQPAELLLGVSPVDCEDVRPGGGSGRSPEALIVFTGSLDSQALDDLEAAAEAGYIWAIGPRRYSSTQEKRWRGRQRLLDAWDAEPGVACRTVAEELAGLRVEVLLDFDLFGYDALPLLGQGDEGWSIKDFQEAVGLLQPLKVVALTVSGSHDFEAQEASEQRGRSVSTAAEAVRAALTSWW